MRITDMIVQVGKRSSALATGPYSAAVAVRNSGSLAGGDCQGLDGERGILRPPEHEKGVGACGRQQEDEEQGEQGDGPFANGDRGKIEVHLLTYNWLGGSFLEASCRLGGKPTG